MLAEGTYIASVKGIFFGEGALIGYMLQECLTA